MCCCMIDCVEEEPRRGWVELNYLNAVENVWEYEGNGLEGNESLFCSVGGG